MVISVLRTAIRASLADDDRLVARHGGGGGKKSSIVKGYAESCSPALVTPGVVQKLTRFRREFCAA